ncbi:MAG: AAA family ATPase [Planctomyces sp.]|jgi:hypothetical protein|nr:AAA family ATPase [Planctomyces sp.]
MPSSDQEPQFYRVLSEYRDKADGKVPEDQLTRWVTPDDGPSIANAGGIRSQRIARAPAGSAPAFIYLFTSHVRTVFDNPWTDKIDHDTATVEYWGDAKFGKERSVGNRLLRQVLSMPPENRPPILHFVRVRVGFVRFSGLCVVREITERDYEDSEGNHVSNLFVQLAILDAPEVSAAWIRARVMEGPGADFGPFAPAAWQRYRNGELVALSPVHANVRFSEVTPMALATLTINDALKLLISQIERDGYIYQPWQIAAYITAIRTRPFVILAGVSGTGKSRLPALVARLTGMPAPQRVAVRPDWNDSSEVLGYTDLQRRFRPGMVLQQMRTAASDPCRFHTCLIDEMNLARVEYYFAELLSSIEDCVPDAHGGFRSTPVLMQQVPDEDVHWQQQFLPPNLSLVGTVNVDESTHTFSRKVLDRAFTIELSHVDFSESPTPTAQTEQSSPWTADMLISKCRRVADVPISDSEFPGILGQTNDLLTRINRLLVYSQMQVGYRIRDEVSIFTWNAREVLSSFRTRAGIAVDPLDLAVMMKVLPRLTGSSGALRQVLAGLIELALTGQDGSLHSDPTEAVTAWEQNGRPGSVEGAALPMTHARLCQMWQRLEHEGYTSFWH